MPLCAHPQRLNATIAIDASIALSSNSFDVTVDVTALSSSFTGRIDDRFVSEVAGYELTAEPTIKLSLQVDNTAVPFTLGEPDTLTSWDFGGSLDTRVVVAVDGKCNGNLPTFLVLSICDANSCWCFVSTVVPAAVTFEARLLDITNVSSVEYDVFVDINLRPINESKLKIFRSIWDKDCIGFHLITFCVAFL